MNTEQELIMIRHGETEWNKNRRYQGQEDVSLNEKGREQARLAAEALAGEDLDMICASDLSRAYDTASELTADRELEVREFPDLRELDFGNWGGQSYEDIVENDEKRFKDWLENPGETSPPEGEAMDEFRERVCGAFDRIIEDEAEKIAVVAHGGSLRIFLVDILGIPLERYTRLYFDNGGITRVKFYDDNPVVTLVNSTHHLQELENSDI